MHLTGPGARRWFERRPLALDLLVISLFAGWFYRPYLTPLLPRGDFPSYVMGAWAEAHVQTSLFALPTWNPYLMCGRPTIGFTSPFRLLALPFQGVEPIQAMKAQVVLYALLGGLAMYALIAGCGAGRDAALFAGLVYPLLPSHVTRAADYGHIHIVMFYAIAPLILLALFRLRRRDLRGTALLALALVAGLVRDAQRTLLLSIMLSLLLALWALVLGVRGALTGQARPWQRPLALLALFAIAFVGGVACDSFELVNGFIGDAYKGDYLLSQAKYVDTWSVRNVYTYLDRDGHWGERIGQVEGLSQGFYGSSSRYLGGSLCLLALLGLLAPRLVAGNRSRFWLALLLAPLSVWLAFGPLPVYPALAARWGALFRSAAIAPASKLALVAALAALVVAVAVGVTRHLALPRGGLLLGAAIASAAFVLPLVLPLLALVQRVVFFLRDFRNPDWFQVTAASFGLLTAAAFVVSGLAARWSARRFWPALYAVIVLASIADFMPYRNHLVESLRGPRLLPEFERLFTAIRDPQQPGRVMSAEHENEFADLAAVWHDRPLAWDFRAHTAPRRTHRFFTNLRFFISEPGDRSLVPILAGLAHVKYIIDLTQAKPAVSPSALLRATGEALGVRIYENLAVLPLVQAYPRANLMVGTAPVPALRATALFAGEGIALAHLEPSEYSAHMRDDFGALYTDLKTQAAGTAPAGAIAIGRDPIPPPAAASADFAPELSWSRPKPSKIVIDARAEERFFAVVAESYHPWWHASVDGQPVQLYPGSYAFLGLFVPAGSHRVELSFERPLSYFALGLVSLASLLALLVASVAPPARLERFAGSVPLTNIGNEAFAAPPAEPARAGRRIARLAALALVVVLPALAVTWASLRWPPRYRVLTAEPSGRPSRPGSPETPVQSAP